MVVDTKYNRHMMMLPYTKRYILLTLLSFLTARRTCSSSSYPCTQLQNSSHPCIQCLKLIITNAALSSETCFYNSTSSSHSKPPFPISASSSSKKSNPFPAFPPQAFPSVNHAKCPPVTGLAMKWAPGHPPLSVS